MSSFLINPFIYSTGPVTYNQYSMWLSGITTQPQQNFYVSAQTNTVDTMLRSANPQFSMSFWFKPMGTQTLDTTSNNGSGIAGAPARAIFSKWIATAGKDRNQFLSLTDTGQLYWWGQYDANNFSVRRLTSSLSIATGTTWYNVVLCYDSSKTTSATIARMYVNGSEITAWTFNTVSTTNKYFNNQTTEANRGNVRIGASQFHGTDQNLPTDSFIGKIDECTFYTTALTASEVMQIYTGTTTGSYTGMSAYSTYCVAHYRMGDASGDVFSNGNWQLQNVKGSTPNMNGSGGTADSRVLDAP
jgi:hypothetical protein